MDVIAMQNLLADLSREVGVVERPRKPHGFWTPYAWAVRALVTMKGMNVSDAAKVVLRNAGLVVTAQDVACVRVVYYKIRDTAWPEGMYDALLGRLGEVDTRSGAAILSDIGADVPEPEAFAGGIDHDGDCERCGKRVTYDGDCTFCGKGEPIPDSEDSPIPDDLRAELEAEVQSGFLDPDADPDYVDPDADPDFQP